MAFSRYANDLPRDSNSRLGMANAVNSIRIAIRNGDLPVIRTIIASGADRMDTLAGVVYGDAKYWWLIAAASGIGWGLQVPPGTVINVLDLRKVESLVG